MKKEKNNRKKKKTGKFKISKRTLLICAAIICIVLMLAIVVYLNSEKHQKKKAQKTVLSWAKEIYEEKIADISADYVKYKAENGESILINLQTLKNLGKDTSVIKNKKIDRVCSDVDTYVTIKVDKNAKNIKKDYKVEKVVLDCFN